MPTLMKMLSDDLIGLPVYTESGEHLGKVVSFDFDIEMQTIEHYHIKTGLIKDLWHQQLVVHHSQVVSISKEKMVVEDTAANKDEAVNLKLAGSAAK